MSNSISELGKNAMISGVVLAVLLLLVSINSTYFFFGIMKVKFVEWMFFNACVPANIAYLLGFAIFLITKDKTALGVGILPMLFFGTMGLFIFPWNGMNLIAQASHIFMTLNAIWAVYATVRTSDFRALSIGLLIGLVIYIPFITIQQIYARNHQEALHRILQIK